MDLTFRPALADDECRELVYSSAPELFDYMYGRSNTSAHDYIAHEFKSGRGFLGHAIHTVAVANREVVGVGAFYTRSQFPSLQRGSALEILRFFGIFGALSVLRRAADSSSVIRPPKPGCVYIANLGVRPDMRGHGVGSALIEHETKKASAAGFAKMTLDVADNNPRAEQLYRKLGFAVVREKQFKGRKGSRVPNVRLMESPIR